MKKILLIIFILIGFNLNAQSNTCMIEQWAKDFNKSTPEFKKFMNDHPDALVIYNELYKSGSKFVLSDGVYITKMGNLNPEVRKYIVAFTDDKAVSTLAKFLDDCDNSAFREAVNNNPILAEAFVGHKNNWTKADYEALADDLDLVTKDAKTQDLISNWMDRSGKITNFGNVVKLGNSLSKNIVAAIKSKKGKLFDDLAKETGIPLDQLKNYDVLIEVPLETTGGFMRADAVLIKRNILGKIDDVIIIENKLSQNTPFTIRQKEGFGAIINGQKEMKI
ncbi:hypothetical protein, partial [Chishuiella sp.]|uniref:hypothetical protein n=1 Tax=Chishuiella sp. TaxID=1969467 RepID=UPI0028AA4809